MKRKIVYLLATILISTTALSGCSKTEEIPVVEVDSEDDVVSYSLVQAQYGDVVLTRNIDCNYAQTIAQDVSFNVTGRYVSKVYVKEGSVVKKGDILCEVSSADLEANIERLTYNVRKNELKLEQLDMEEALDIQDQWVNATSFGTSSEVVGEIVKGIKEGYARRRVLINDSLEFDREELARKKEELRTSKLYAQLDGVVYKLASRLEGTTSKADKVIMTIVDQSSCIFEAKDTTYRNLFHEGEPVSMKVGYSSASGEYLLLPYEIDKWEDSMKFSVYTGPDEGALEVGVMGTISVVEETKKNVLYVPKDVVRIADDKAYVYTLSEDNIREIRYIEIGLYGDDKVEVLSGLVEGEKVVKK
ncbi:MAG: efflux RND transporter periplasmic adaptor subunit [Lachnospiraceae bacterium]|nr:efflux RND transporter periplasmic adaptor subunit [Lachnospiraceae bacterium]